MKSKLLLVIIGVFCLNSGIGASTISHENEFQSLLNLLLKSESSESEPFYHYLKATNLNERTVTLKDESVWKVHWWYRNTIVSWQEGERLKITFDNYYAAFKIENIDQHEMVWSSLVSLPPVALMDSIQIVYDAPNQHPPYSTLKLKSGWTVHAAKQTFAPFSKWKAHEYIFILHDSIDYTIFNLNRSEMLSGCCLSKVAISLSDKLDLLTILKLEEHLNKIIVDQPEATQAVTNCLLNYALGINNPESPAGVFLFLGPTGVGKTELAKALASQVYPSGNSLLRLDMSHFGESCSATRLIGSPPGYVNHEEGGQLTEPLKENPCRVVLLDEIEKAHPTVTKYFLPLFDEGFIRDASGYQINCQDSLFILTSNLLSEEITELHSLGMASEEILKLLEPKLMAILSPELYNRLQPVLFLPLSEEAIEEIMEKLLAEVSARIKQVKDIKLTIDPLAKSFLLENGYHPTLGVRPMKRLIEKKVTTTLAYAIAKEGIPDGSRVTLFYDALEDSWLVKWTNH